MAHRWFSGLALVFAAGLGLFLLMRPGFEGDTQALITQAAAGAACLQRGQLSRCPGAGAFPLFQYFPSVLLLLAGAGRGLILKALAYASFACFLLMLRISFTELRKRSRAVAWAALAVLLSGYDLRYANLSFGEMGAAFFSFAFMVACLMRKRLPTVCVLLFVACVTKEIAFIFLLWMGLSAILLVPEARRPPRDFAVIAATAAIAVICNGLLNVFRFATPINVGYLALHAIVPDLRAQLDNLFAIWFSPTGGIAPFWPSYFATMALAATALARRERGRAFGLSILAALFGLSVGFSKWSSPLGGYNWGDRYMLPWLPAALFSILWAYARECEAALARWASRPAAFWTTSVALAVAAFPQYAILFRHSLIGKVMDVPVCPDMPPSRAYHCFLWPSHWGILEFYRPWPRPDLFVAGLFACSTFILLCRRAVKPFSMQAQDRSSRKHHPPTP